MNKQVKTCLKTVWLVAATMIFIAGTSLCFSTDPNRFQAADTMFFLMFLISFPTGLCFLVASSIFLDGGNFNQPSQFITTWMLLTGGGLLQWFVLVPRMFEEHPYTTLNLEITAPPQRLVAKQAETRTEGNALSSAIPAFGAVGNDSVCTATSELRGAPHRTRTRRVTFQPIAAFDRKGRSPFERVIEHYSRVRQGPFNQRSVQSRVRSS